MNDNHLNKAMYLVKAYDKLCQIPEKDRVTSHHDEKFSPRYNDALAAIGRNDEQFQDDSRFDDEQYVLKFMRKYLLYTTLKEGDLVVCVPPYEVFNDNGSTYYTYEKINWIDSNGMCGVHLMGEERWITIEHVLARYNADLDSAGAFYMPCAELMFLDNEDEAMPILLAAQKQRDGIAHSLSVMTKAFAANGLNPDNGRPLTKKQKCGKGKSTKKPKLMEQLDAGKRKASEKDSKKTSSKSKKKDVRE